MGKEGEKLLVSKDATENEVKKEMQNIKNIKDALSEKNILKSIYVPNKILNIVVKT
jgi:leucyl-tRNA synthetase